MSTKCTVTYGNIYHIYEECYDEKNIYVELGGISEVHVETFQGQSKVTFSLDRALWDRIISEYTQKVKDRAGDEIMDIGDFLKYP